MQKNCLGRALPEKGWLSSYLQTSSGLCLLQQKFAFCICLPNNLSFAEHGSAWLLTETASSPTAQETQVACAGRGGAGSGRGKPRAARSVCPLWHCVTTGPKGQPGHRARTEAAEKWQTVGGRERNTTVKPHLACHKLVRSKSRLADQVVILNSFFFFKQDIEPIRHHDIWNAVTRVL